MNNQADSNREKPSGPHRSRAAWSGSCALLALGFVLFLLAGSASAATEDRKPWEVNPVEPLAQVASATGAVQARARSGETRSLAIGDPVYPGERVSAGPTSSAGLWIGDVLVQLEQNSRVLFVGAPKGATRVTLEDGGVRIVDPRASGPAIELVALGATTRIVGGDREARILKEKTGPYAIFSDWAGPFSVTRGGESVAAGPGQSIVANKVAAPTC